MAALTPEAPPLPDPFLSVRPLHVRRTFVVVVCDPGVALIEARFHGQAELGVAPMVDVPTVGVRTTVLPVPADSVLTEITAVDRAGVALGRLDVHVPGHDGAWRAGNRSGRHVTDPWRS